MLRKPTKQRARGFRKACNFCKKTMFTERKDKNGRNLSYIIIWSQFLKLATLHDVKCKYVSLFLLKMKFT